VVGDIPQREFDVLRAPPSAIWHKTQAQLLKQCCFGSGTNGKSHSQRTERGTYPKFSWDIFPQFRQELFDPPIPWACNFWRAPQVRRNYAGLSLNGEVEANIWDNFNTNRSSDSVLPHVRTDFVKYFTQGKNGIGDLEGDYNFRISPDVFALVRPVIWKACLRASAAKCCGGLRTTVGIGGRSVRVQQRDFDRLFGLQSYRVLTGHVSLYYASPWYGLNFIVRAGQYLEGIAESPLKCPSLLDRRRDRRFFTKTNVSAAQFGEGSFDKGIVLRIPIGWVAPIDTQSELGTILRPVQRDGGQELAGDAVLYDETRRTSMDEIYLQNQVSN